MRAFVWRFVTVIGIAVAALPVASAQVAVPKLVHIVVPFSPGASNDVIARAIAPRLAKRLDTTVIVENKPGAAGTIGADSVAKGPRDGSMLLLTSSTFLTAAATQPKIPYDALTAFAPVAIVGEGPLIVAVSASTPYKTPAELVNAARAKPGAINYGTAGVGSIAHLATELLNDAAKMQTLHVPYKGAANAATDLASGEIQFMISNYSTLAPLIAGGKVRAIAVTSRQKHPAFPDLPPLAATVPDYAIDIWVGVFAPAGTPAPLVERLNREINDIAASADLKPVLEPDGAAPVALTPGAFGARLSVELAQWKRVASEHKIVAE